MKSGLVDIVCVLDRSGSMAYIADDAIGGFNEFLKQQQELPGEAKMTVVLFDGQYEIMYDGVDVKDVKELDNKTFVPRGTTALLDALGKTINAVGERLAKTPEEDRPEHVIFMVLTDGLENASKEFTNDQIHDMIEHQETVYSWKFVYLAANQDAFVVGNQLSFTNSVNFKYDKVGTRSLFTAHSNVVSCLRGGGSYSDAVQSYDHVVADDRFVTEDNKSAT